MNFKNYLAQKGVAGELAGILLDLTGVAVQVAEAMRIEKKGYAGTENVYGEKQLKMDVLANELFVGVLRKNKAVALIGSEELEEALDGPAVASGMSLAAVQAVGAAEAGLVGQPAGVEADAAAKSYSVAFDPLDGSSLADVNLAVGSIVGIYQGSGFIGKKGSDQVAVLIAVYGPRLTLMVSVGKGTDEFTYDYDCKNFILTSADLKLLAEAKMFAPGNLRASISEEWYLELMEYWIKNGYILRYSGGMVPDVNQIFKKGGGIFTYPGYKEQPQGKLRLLYECAPFAMLVEQAGGKAMTGNFGTGNVRILDLVIEDLHQKTPVFLGSGKEVDLAISYKKSSEDKNF